MFQPDMAPNVGAMMRLCACMDVGLDIIEPCGFPWDINKIRKAGMDYVEAVDIKRHESWDAFLSHYPQASITLMTTKGSVPYTDYSFHRDDILLAGRESEGAPDYVHERADGRILIPMKNGLRSLNIVNASSMILGEALRQTR